MPVPPARQLTPDELTYVIRELRGGVDMVSALRRFFPSISPGDVASMAGRTLEAIARRAAEGTNPNPWSRNALRALQQAAPEFPEAIDFLKRIVHEGRPVASEAMTVLEELAQTVPKAMTALEELAQAMPEKVMPVLKQIVDKGGPSAASAYRVIASAATQGIAAARDMLKEIARNPGAFATAALALLRQLGLRAAGAAVAAQTGIAAIMAGISTTALVATGAGIVVAGLIAGYIWSQGDRSVEPGARMTGQQCAPLTQTPRKCPWTPDGYSVNPCGPGFCWDGGPQGSLACKQEEGVPNAGRNYTTDLVCNEGFTPVRDPCTNVILRCDRQ